jgi:KaiC/GvpD/RAD55 family RecA-like ATPase/predicted transcriptional regulator
MGSSRIKTTDSTSRALLDWLRRGGLDHDWKMDTTTCATCRQKAFRFQSGKDLLFVLCPHCSNPESSTIEAGGLVNSIGEVAPTPAGASSGAPSDSGAITMPASAGGGEAPERESPQASKRPLIPPPETTVVPAASASIEAENQVSYDRRVSVGSARAPRRREARQHPMVKTGSQLDDIIGGLPQGSLILVSGSPGSGHDLFVRQILYNAAVAGTGVSYFAMDDSFERVISEMFTAGFDVEALPRQAWEFIDAHKVKRGVLGVTSLRMMLESIAEAAANGRWSCIDTFSNVTDLLGEDEAMSFLDDFVECAREGRGVHFLILPDGVINQRLDQLVSCACDGHMAMELDEGEAGPVGKLRIKHMSMMNQVQRSFAYAISPRGVAISSLPGAPTGESVSSESSSGDLTSLESGAFESQASEGKPSPPITKEPESAKPGGLRSPHGTHIETVSSYPVQGPYDGILMAVGHDALKNGRARLSRVYGLANLPYREFRFNLDSMEKKGLVRTRTDQGQIQVELTVLGAAYLLRHEKA